MLELNSKLSPAKLSKYHKKVTTLIMPVHGLDDLFVHTIQTAALKYQRHHFFSNKNLKNSRFLLI